jgi:NitT/TauT family transport system substrate-binding protein
MKLRFALVVGLGAGLLYTGNAAAADPLKIRIGWIVAPAELTPYMFAKEGIARQSGSSYVLEPIHFQGSPLEITAVQSGDLDVAPFGSSSFAIAVENAGLTDLRIIADEVQDGVPGWGGPEFRVLKDSPIKTIDDLRGKVLVTNIFGGETDIAIKLTMLKHNMNANRDYTEIQAEMANMNSLLLEHKADLVDAVHPFQDDPAFRAQSRLLFRPADTLGKFELSFLTARAAYIAAHRDVLIDFLEDYVRAFHWYLDPSHRAEAIQIVAAVTKRPAATFERFLFTHEDECHDPDAMPDLDAVTSNIKAQHEVGLTKAEFNGRDYADLSLLREAIARTK